jgi:hypothetical protein
MPRQNQPVPGRKSGGARRIGRLKQRRFKPFNMFKPFKSLKAMRAKKIVLKP